MPFSTKNMPGIVASLVLFASVAAPAFGWESYGKDNDFKFDQSTMGKNRPATITSDQMMEMGGSSTADGLKIESDMAMRHGKIDRAIEVLAKSVEMSPNDSDAHAQYAEALEKKLYSQKKRDPKLYNLAVKNWLFVARKSEFDDEKTKGFTHLAKLCGRVPGQYETQKHFLSKALVSEDVTTTATVTASSGRVAADSEPTQPTRAASTNKNGSSSMAASKADATR